MPVKAIQGVGEYTELFIKHNLYILCAIQHANLSLKEKEFVM